MSEPVSKAEVEDVLSSIRKLVSDDAVAQTEVASAPATPVLVLSEDTVIQEENQGFEAVEPVAEEPVATPDVSWNSSFIVAGTPSEETEVTGAQPEVAFSTEAESVAVEEGIVEDTAVTSEEFSENAVETEGDVVDFTALAEAPISEFEASEHPSEVAAFQRLEDKAAHMETMVSDQADDWETDGTELADLDVGNLSGFEVSAKPETADIYVLSQQEAVTDAPFVLEEGFSADTAPTAEAEPFILTAAALVAREDIVLGAGSITPEELTVDGQEGEAAPVESDPAEAFATGEFVSEEQVAADIEAFVENDPPVTDEDSEAVAEAAEPETPVTSDESAAAEVVEETLPAAEAETAEVLDETGSVQEMDTSDVDLPSAEQVEEELTDALAAVEPVENAEVETVDAVEAEQSETVADLAEQVTDVSSNAEASEEAVIFEGEEAVVPELAEAGEVDAEVADIADSDTAEALPEVEDETVVAAVAETDVVEVDASPDTETSEDLAAAETAVPPMDEDKLRELVADVVRQELRGALGERITRNMRKMVRREIYRTVSSRDLES